MSWGITLQILPVSGNINNFPFTGVLGVTDVVVRGRVVAGLDERASGKAPDARRIVVRLVRAEGWDGKALRETNKDIVDEKVLWTPADGAESERFVPHEHRFALKVPHDFQGLSEMQFKVGTCQASVAWRIEAFVDTAKDGRIEAQQSRALSLVRHATTPLFPAPYPDHGWASTSTSPAPFDYDLRVPNEPFGVLEPLAVETHFRLPAGCGLQIKSFKLWLRREVTNSKSGAQFQTTHDFALEADESARPARPNKRFASVFGRSTSSVGPSTTTTPPSEDERALHGRTPSPPSDVDAAALFPHRFPLVAHDAAEVIERGRFRVRIPGQGTHRWAVGETGESSVFRISFALAGKISYKQRNGGSASIDLAPIPVHVCAAVDPSIATKVAQRLGDRRNSDFALQLKFDRTSPGPSAPHPAYPDAGVEHRLSAAHLPLPYSSSRPCQGRRMSEHSDANDAPARTRVRRDPPAPLPVPNATIPSPSSATSIPPAVSRSSTFETLGPDTPSTMEFLASSTLPPHMSPKLSPYPHHHSGSSSSQPSRHPPRSTRSAARYRPRSSGSQRSSTMGDSTRSVSNLSIASLASASSATSDPLRPLPAGSSLTLLASADRMVGLSLGDEGMPVELLPTTTEDDGDARMLDRFASTRYPSPSPPSSPEPSSPLPNLASVSAFSNPFAVDDSAPVGVGKELPVLVPEMYVSPRHAALSRRPRRPSTAPAYTDGPLSSGLTIPASPTAPPPLPPLLPLVEAPSSRTNLLLAPSSAEGSNPASRRSSFAAGSPPVLGARKGSIGMFISSFLGRRGSKPVAAPSS